MKDRVMNLHSGGFPDPFRAVHPGVPDREVFRIPERSPVTDPKDAVIDEKVTVFPESITGPDITVLSLDIHSVFDGAFSRRIKTAMTEKGVPFPEHLSFTRAGITGNRMCFHTFSL
jgi:hypothetical protein